MLDLSDHAPGKAHFLFCGLRLWAGWFTPTLAGREKGSTGSPHHSHPPKPEEQEAEAASWEMHSGNWDVCFRRGEKKREGNGRGGEGKEGEERMAPSSQWWLQPGVSG